MQQRMIKDLPIKELIEIGLGLYLVIMFCVFVLLMITLMYGIFSGNWLTSEILILGFWNTSMMYKTI